MNCKEQLNYQLLSLNQYCMFARTYGEHFLQLNSFQNQICETELLSPVNRWRKWGMGWESKTTGWFCEPTLARRLPRPETRALDARQLPTRAQLFRVGSETSRKRHQRQQIRVAVEPAPGSESWLRQFLTFSSWSYHLTTSYLNLRIYSMGAITEGHGRSWR